MQEIENLLLSGLTSAIFYVSQLIVFTAVLFYLNWRLAFVSLFVAPFFWLAARHFSRGIKRAGRKERRRSGSIVAARPTVAGPSVSGGLLDLAAIDRLVLFVRLYRFALGDDAVEQERGLPERGL
jgi:ATP-binding cassette subfamily B protein